MGEGLNEYEPLIPHILFEGAAICMAPRFECVSSQEHRESNECFDVLVRNMSPRVPGFAVGTQFPI